MAIHKNLPLFFSFGVQNKCRMRLQIYLLGVHFEGTWNGITACGETWENILFITMKTYHHSLQILVDIIDGAPSIKMSVLHLEVQKGFQMLVPLDENDVWMCFWTSSWPNDVWTCSWTSTWPNDVWTSGAPCKKSRRVSIVTCASLMGTSI